MRTTKSTAKAKAPAKRTARPRQLKIVKSDEWLRPFEGAIQGRHDHALHKIEELTGGKGSLSDFADGHLYFGLHRTPRQWILREWAPNATAIYLVGTFNNWQESPEYAFTRIPNTDNWQLKLPAKALHHLDLYKLSVHWSGGQGERVPAWARRVVQDEQTKIFSAQVWYPKQGYEWKNPEFRPKRGPLFIYECHIGMAQDAEKVGTYNEFRLNVLPRIIADGYNCIQIMAIAEHPYYGSFGYHVSSFFAPSSRFGTPDELKQLIDAAHQAGISVIMDLVHSHAVKTKSRAWAITQVTLTNSSTLVHVVSIRHGIVSASIMAKTRLYISCSLIVSIGSPNSISMGSASMASRLCSITVTDLARAFANMAIISTAIKTTMPFAI